MNLSSHGNWRTRCFLAAALSVFLCLPSAESQGEDQKGQRVAPPRKDVKEFQRVLPRKAPTSDIVLIGKAVCSLKRIVGFPYQGTIVSLEVTSGQEVKKGDVLATYRLTPEALISLRSQLHSPDVKQHEIDLLELRLGTPLAPEQLPAQVELKAPITGHVIWIHPDLQEGAQLGPLDRVFEVGVMKPICLRAHVYEEEALRLALGDSANLQPESRPGWKFKGHISRISWTPLSLDPLSPSYYEVELTAANKDLILREGMRVIIHLFKPLSMKPGVREGGHPGEARSAQ